MNKKRKEIINGNEVSVVKTYKLGGFDQKVLIEGKTKDLPVLITLHGGPGSPIPFCVGARGLFPDFTDKCILVSWDQYGCGINNAVLDENLSISDFVQMAIDLIRVLKQEFKENKIYLFGMSWGSVLSAKAAAENPEIINGAIIYGQVLNRLMRTEDAVSALMNSNATQKIKEQLEIILANDVPTSKEAMAISKWVRKYTQGYQNRKEPKANISSMIKGIISSPDYKFKDFIAIMKNGYMKNCSIMKELSEIDLTDTLGNIRIPYHIIQGDTDIVTSTKEISKFIDKCDNRHLQLSVVKNAAHIPGINGMGEVMKIMQQFFS